MLTAFEKCGKKCWPHSTYAVKKIGRKQKVRSHRNVEVRSYRNTKVRPEMTAFLPMRSLWPHLCTYGMAAISRLSPFSAVLTITFIFGLYFFSGSPIGLSTEAIDIGDCFPRCILPFDVVVLHHHLLSAHFG